jgi:hypothetical protein
MCNSNPKDLDKASKKYAEQCLAYIHMADDPRHDYMDLAQMISREQQPESVHPMLRSIQDRAFDIGEDMVPLLPPEEKEEAWQELARILQDFLAGKWQTTTWVMTGTYLDSKRGHSFGFLVGFQNQTAYIRTADKQTKNLLELAIQKLNPEQTEQRFLQNTALVIPKSIKKYTLYSIEITEN